MRPARTVLLLLAAAACGKAEGDAAPVAAPSAPLVEGKTFETWCAELGAPATAATAAATLSRIGESDARVLPALVGALGNADAAVRRAAADGLGRIGEPAVNPTAALLDNSSEPTRDAAGDALVAVGPAGLRRLVVALGDPNPRVGAAAASALRRAGQVAVAPLTDGLTLGNAATRGPAAKCLAALNATAPLVAALADDATRAAASDALVSMGRGAIAALEAARSEPKTRDAVEALLARIRASVASEAVKSLRDPAKRAAAVAELSAMGDAATPTLVAGLAGDSAEVRDACADVLVARGPECAKHLEPYLVDGNPAARTTAVRALLACGDEGSNALLRALDVEDGAVRGAVAAELRRSESGIGVLVAALVSGEPRARATAGGAVADAGVAALAALEDAALKRGARARTVVVDSLGDIGPPAFPTLGRLLAAPDRALRESAADALARAGAPAVETLIAALASVDPDAQSAAARALVRVGAPAQSALGEASRGADAGLAARAREVLVRLGGGSVSELVKMAASADATVRLDAVRALGRLAANSDEALASLVAALADADASVRAAAARGLCDAGPRAKSASAALDKLLRDKSPQVRVEAAAALYVGGATTTALPHLAAGLKDKDAAVRALAAEAFARARVPAAAATPDLVHALRNDDSAAVRIAAIRALVAVGASGDVVGSWIAESARSSDPVERAEAQAALPRISDLPIFELIRFGGAMRGDRVRRAKAKEAGSNAEVEKAVAAALDWLARHQAPDGSWSAGGFDARCKDNRCDGPGMAQFTPGVTGLALLAFLGAGESQAYGPHKEAVARGIAYLTSIQDSEGRVGPSRGGETFFHEASSGFLGGSRTPTDGLMYNHAIATIALCESYMLSGDERTKAAAAKAAEFTVRAKNPYLAWRYNFPPDGDNDTSVTGWMCWAIATAHAAEIEVDRSAIKDALAWINKMTEPEFGRTGYQQRGGPPGRLASMLSKFPSDKSESLTAMGVFARVLAGHTPRDDEFIVKSADLVVKKLPRWDVDAGRIDFYYWFWGSAAMRQVGGDHWKRWSDALKEALLGAQRAEKGRDERGSFDPVDCWSPAGGRVYSTALCCMSLESFWRTDRLGNWK